MSSEIVVIGGGIIGLAIAVELKLHLGNVTVLSRDCTEAAAYVAAGMLAPQAENIPPSPMLDLCLRSRSLYGNWTSKLEAITGLDTGYWQCGILAPVYDENDNHQSCQPTAPNAQWLAREEIHQHQPGLGEEVVGGWWFRDDAQVDNRRSLVKALTTAAKDLGVNILEGVEVEEIVPHQDEKVEGVQTNQGIITGDHYILATGAWSGKFLSLPVHPKKGQLLSVWVPPEQVVNLPLQQILYGENIYIVPRRDGLIVIGATAEDVGFAAHNTPQGMHTLLSRAIRLYPTLKNFPIQEFWWGYRPATPDALPILGTSPYDNLTLAVGHYRNGILLAPITAKLIGDLVLENKFDPLLGNFNWQRLGLSNNYRN